MTAVLQVCDASFFQIAIGKNETAIFWITESNQKIQSLELLYTTVGQHHCKQ